MRKSFCMILCVAVTAGIAGAGEPIQPEVELTYYVKWTGIAVGESVLSIKGPIEANGEQVLILSAFTRSNNFIKMFYPVDDRIESVVGVDDRLPRRFTKRLREGSYRKDELMIFDRDRGKVAYYKKPNDDEEKESKKKEREEKQEKKRGASARMPGRPARPGNVIWAKRWYEPLVEEMSEEMPAEEPEQKTVERPKPKVDPDGFEATIGEFLLDKIVEFPEETHDPLSCLLFLGAEDFEVGESYTYKVNTDRKNWELVLEVKERDEIRVGPFGRQDAILVRPKFKFEGLFRRKGDIDVWLHEDLKIPLRMKVDIPIGNINMKLIKAEGVEL